MNSNININYTDKYIAASQTDMEYKILSFDLINKDEIIKNLPNTISSRGVYIFFSDVSNPKIYIGETKNFKQRLSQHKQSKKEKLEGMMEAMFIYCADDSSISKDDLLYIESEMIKLSSKKNGEKTVEGNVWQTINANSGQTVKLSDLRKNNIDENINKVRRLMGMLEKDYFAYSLEVKDEINIVQPIGEEWEVTCKIANSNEIVNGIYYPNSNKLKVLAGPKGEVSWRKYTSNNNQGSIDNIKKIDNVNWYGDKYEFVNDHVFSSPTMAAFIFQGGFNNGITSWKVNSSGKTIKETKIGYIK